MVLVVCGVANPARAQQTPFPGRTVLSAPASPTRMPDFDLTDLHGGMLRSAQIKGKVIVIRFWATW